MNVFYFLPTIGTEHLEIESITNVVEKVQTNTGLPIQIIPNWSELMLELQGSTLEKILVVFRIDYLERENMSLDEVLSMLSSLTRFVSETKVINIAVVVNRKCDEDLIATFKRNNVLGIIPGLRFFDNEHSFTAYKELAQGNQHWPAVAIATPPRFIRKKLGVDLTVREQEIFKLVTYRGLSNKKIAALLSITEDTVKSHVGSIMKKYGVRNRTQLALARETGIIK